MEIKDGGSAFPTIIYKRETGDTYADLKSIGGMTLRDYFAAAYIKGIYACPIDGVCGNFLDVAKDAYASADAMLKAREQ